MNYIIHDCDNLEPQIQTCLLASANEWDVEAQLKALVAAYDKARIQQHWLLYQQMNDQLMYGRSGVDFGDGESESMPRVLTQAELERIHQELIDANAPKA